MKYKTAYAFASIQLIDFIETALAVPILGAREINPVSDFIGFVPFLILKFCAVVGLTYKLTKPIARWLQIFAVVAPSIIVLSNAWQIWSRIK